MPESRKKINNLHGCTCGCNRLVSRITKWRHTKTPSSAVVQLGCPPPPKRRRVAHSQADAGSSASVHPQLYAHSFEFDPSPPLLDLSAASSLLQPPGDAPTNAPSHLVDDVLRSYHARTHRTTDESDNEDSEIHPMCCRTC